MNRISTLVIALLCAALPATAAAQATAAAPPASTPAEEAEARRVLYAHGMCLVREVRRRAERYLETLPATKAAESAARRLLTEECPSAGELAFTLEALRGPIYQALYREDYGNRPVPDLEGVAAIDYSVGKGAVDPETAPVHVALRNFADCVTRRNHPLVHRLVLTEVASEDEKAAFQMLVPGMSACLVQGTTVKFTRPLLRAVLAETLYRLSAAKMGRQFPRSGT